VREDSLKVPKTLKEVVLWVHPEGKVVGSLYLRQQGLQHAGQETVLEALNKNEPFVVFKRSEPHEHRFYNRKSIIRVEYSGREYQVARTIKPLHCQLQLMDGALFRGTIQEPLHPDQARLLDYLNKKDETFIKLHVDELTILINKSYIVHVYVDNLEDK